MSEKRKEIYARFGVQLTRSRRAFKAERKALGAMGLYAFCVMYSRDELLDGFVPEEVALTAWGLTESDREPQAEALIDVDLLERVEGGFRIVKYEEHNDTAEEVQSNRVAARERMKRVRGTIAERSPDVQRTEGVVRRTNAEHDRTNAFVPSSCSVSDLGSEIREESTPRARDTRPDEVWDHYVAVRKTKRPNMRKATLDAKDRKAILEALKAYDVESLKLACEGLFLSSHHLGQNDRGTEYLGIEYAVKPRNIEGFIAAAQDARPAPLASGSMPVAEACVSAEDIDAVLAEITRKQGAS